MAELHKRLGQIVYNLFKADGTRLYTSSNLTEVISYGGSGVLSGIVDISNDIIEPIKELIKNNEDYDSDLMDVRLVRLGIQAPEGTQLTINDSTLIIGPTDTFQMSDYAYSITSLSVPNPSIIKNLIIDFYIESYYKEE